MGCRPPESIPQRPLLEVRYRPGSPSGQDGRTLLSRIPLATWDDGLRRAVEDLLAASHNRTARIPPHAASLAAARAGFPGQARFARHLNGGAFPEELLDDLQASARHHQLDVAMGRRDFGDGMTLWILGWAPHVVEFDPIPALLDLDAPLALRMESDDARSSRLFLAPPNGPVEELNIRSEVHRIVDRFHIPGTYRLEVIVGEHVNSEVALLFSVFVDSPLPSPPQLSSSALPPPDPIQAEHQLYAALDELREERGLQPVERFPLFESVAREHAALMGAYGEVRHRIPGVTQGVPVRARAMSQPAARHHESVAVAASAEEAMQLIVDSPAHLRSLLCEPCTHASIGVALEPTLDRTPRLLFTWELLEFPAGMPAPFYP